jgi:hypothetical protein
MHHTISNGTQQQQPAVRSAVYVCVCVYTANHTLLCQSNLNKLIQLQKIPTIALLQSLLNPVSAARAQLFDL